MNAMTAFVLGCWFGGALVGLVICIVYREDIFPPGD